MLDLIAYRKNNSPQLGPGIDFFNWDPQHDGGRVLCRAKPAWMMFHGQRRLGHFSVPAEAVEYALKRSGLG